MGGLFVPNEIYSILSHKLQTPPEMTVFTGYLRLGLYSETIGDKATDDNANVSKTEYLFLIREYGLVDKDMGDEDDEQRNQKIKSGIS